MYVYAVRGLVQEMNTVLDKDKQPEMMDKFNKGIFTLRDMYEQFQVRSYIDLCKMTFVVSYPSYAFNKLL
jgi:signal recognition particle GTPase